MGTVLKFNTRRIREAIFRDSATDPTCEIVIFPGVRIERHELDLSHRIRESTGRGEFDNIGSLAWPRKSG